MQVTDDIPPPTKPRRNGVYPWRDMGIGSSFPVDLAEVRRTRSAAYIWRRRHPGFEFVLDQDATGQWRVWRTG